MSVSTQTYSFCDHHTVELEAPPAAAGECRARIRSTPAEVAAGQALERWEVRGRGPCAAPAAAPLLRVPPPLPPARLPLVSPL